MFRKFWEHQKLVRIELGAVLSRSFHYWGIDKITFNQHFIEFQFPPTTDLSSPFFMPFSTLLIIENLSYNPDSQYKNCICGKKQLTCLRTSRQMLHLTDLDNFLASRHPLSILFSHLPYNKL